MEVDLIVSIGNQVYNQLMPHIQQIQSNQRNIAAEVAQVRSLIEIIMQNTPAANTVCQPSSHATQAQAEDAPNSAPKMTDVKAIEEFGNALNDKSFNKRTKDFYMRKKYFNFETCISLHFYLFCSIFFI